MSASLRIDNNPLLFKLKKQYDTGPKEVFLNEDGNISVAVEKQKTELPHFMRQPLFVHRSFIETKNPLSPVIDRRTMRIALGPSLHNVASLRIADNDHMYLAAREHRDDGIIRK